MQQAAPVNGMQESQRGEVRIHPDGGTVITARMPSDEECTSGYAPGMPVLAVTSPDGQTRAYPADMVALVIGDREATADEARDAARSVLANITEDLGNLGAKLDEFHRALGQSPGSLVHLAARLADEREQEWWCWDVAECSRYAGAGDVAGRIAGDILGAYRRGCATGMQIAS